MVFIYFNIFIIEKENFSILCSKNYKFVIVNEEIIRLKKVDIITLIPLNETDMTALNIVYILRYNSNFIFFINQKKLEFYTMITLEKWYYRRSEILLN